MWDLRIVQIVETLETGGAEKLVVALSGALAEAGHPTTIVTLAGLGPLGEELGSGADVINLGMNPRNLLSQIMAVIRLRRLCGLLGAKAVQTHLPRANFFGLVVALSGGPAVFPTVHNNREFDYGLRVGALRRRMRILAYRLLLSRCRRMVAVSQVVKESLVSELGLEGRQVDRIAVVPNGIVLPPIPSSEARAAARREFGVPGDCRLIVGVGRLTAQKNFRDLILALKGLDPATPEWHCLIAGDGPQHHDLVTLVDDSGLKKRARFLGRISDVDRLLSAADLFCMPSLWEGLPLALLEGMAAGLPIAAYGIDGVREIVPEGLAGRLVEPGDIEMLSAAIRGLLLDPAARTRMGEAGRSLIERDHGLEKMVQSLTLVFRNA